MLKMKPVFVFKSLTEMVKDPVSYKFILKDKPYEDRRAIFSFYIYDNYKIYEVFASKKQSYSYFDFDTSVFTEGEHDAQDFPSLTDYLLIDENDSEDSNTITNTGRSNDFTSNFAGKVKGNYYNRLTDLVNMWIVVEGLPNATPGQVIEIFFPQGISADALYSYQYSGFWLIQKVVHNIGEGFMTKLLLTRQGLDTDKKTTLVKATKRRKA